MWARYLVALVFVLLATFKAVSIGFFATALTQMGLVPQSISTLTAIALIIAELLTGVLLLLPKHHLLANRAVYLLTGGFITFNLYRIVTHMPMPCGCLGTFYSLSPAQGLILGLILNLLVTLDNARAVLISK